MNVVLAGVHRVGAASPLNVIFPTVKLHFEPTAVNESEIRLKATLRLHDDVASYRKSGCRTVCEFEHTVFPDGSRLVGVEASLLDRDRLKPGEEGLVEMRLWVPRDDFREVRAGTRFERTPPFGNG